MNSKWIKRIALILTMCLLMCFTGCNNGGDPSEEMSSSDTSENVEPEDLHKVGFIFSGKADEFSFTSGMNDQRVMASNRSSMDTCYIENVEISDFETAVTTLADAGCTDIVSCSSNFTNIANLIAKKYLNLNFIIYGSTSGSANSIAYTEHPFQGAYVAGLVAAHNTNVRKIGVVVDSDLVYDTAVANAIALGTKLVFNNVTTYVAEAHADDEIEEAINELINRGSDVIITYTTSSHSADYCQRRGVKFISNHDHSGNYSDYSNMLMYYYCKRDSFFLAKFKQMQLDQWQPENYVGSMANGIVNVSNALKACEEQENTQKIIDAILPKLAKGTAYIFSGELIQNNGVVKYLKGEEMTYTEIYGMDWYVDGVELVQSFRKPHYNETPNTFEVKQ